MKIEKVSARSLIDVYPLIGNSPWAQKIADEASDAEGNVLVTWDPVAPGHFLTYCGVIPLRDYAALHRQMKNPPYRDPFAIQALYALHEMVHMRRFRYNYNDMANEWIHRMTSGEFYASLMTECLVYLNIPGLREFTFRHEIWVDRFLRDPKFKKWAIEDIEAFIWQQRIKVYTQPDTFDFLEMQIANYSSQTPAWIRIWAEPVGVGEYASRPAWTVVEECLERHPSLEYLQEWFDRVSGPVEGMSTPQPFPHQAEAFAKVYKASGTNFGNWILMT